MRKNNFNNYAFLDGQNLNLGIREFGWKLDFLKFRKYRSNGKLSSLLS